MDWEKYLKGFFFQKVQKITNVVFLEFYLLLLKSMSVHSTQSRLVWFMV